MTHSFFNNFTSLAIFSCCIGPFLLMVFNVPPATANYKNERIISDTEVINASHGVPVDYSYNETTAKDDVQLGSVPGCPKSIDGFPWVYYSEPPRCFLAGHDGPCPFQEKLMIVRGSPFGVCACECLMGTEHKGRSLILPERQGRYLFCNNTDEDALLYKNMRVYDKKESKCYKMFEQGPCQHGSVITSWTSDSLECFPVCDEKSNDWQNLRDQGLCKQKPVFRLYFRDDEDVDSQGLIPRRNCRKGERYSSALKTCVQKFEGGDTIIG